MKKENIIIILIALCFILFLLYLNESTKAKETEQFFQYCRMHCDEVKVCSDRGARDIQSCLDSYGMSRWDGR